jgi:hypothetical protein
MNRATNSSLTAILIFVTAASCFAANPSLGTWKFNDAKSQMAPGVSRNATITYSQQDHYIKVVTDGTDPDGKPKHTVWVGRFDGKAYPVKGNASSSYNSVSIRVMNDHAQFVQGIRDGKVMWWGTITISEDGKTRTALLHSTDSKGKKFTVKKVYDRT